MPASKRRNPIQRSVLSEKELSEVNDIVTIAFIFIGLGVGLAVGQPAAGLVIGAGVGIVARGLSKYKYRNDNAAISLSFSVAGYLLLVMGLYFILIGIALFYGMSVLSPYLASLPLIVLGVALIAIFYKKRMRK